MKISFVNHLCSGQATIASNTITSVGEEYQLEPYKGIPMGIHSDGTIVFEFSETKQVSFVGLYGFRWNVGTLAECTAIITLKLGGVTQTTVNILLDNVDTFDLDANFAVVLDQEYDCDEISLRFLTFLADIDYSTLRRFWVGTYVEFEKIGQTRFNYLDPTVYEETSKGCLFATQGRVKRELQLSEVVFEDSWFTDETETSKEFGKLVESLMQSGSRQEVAIVGPLYDSDMHGRFTNSNEYRKLSGIQYSTNLAIREF